MTTRSTFTTGDGEQIAYRTDGREDAPWLVLSGSIATTMRMWDGQVDDLARHHRVLRYDARGHGGSSVPAGAQSADRLGRDVVELLDHVGARRVSFVGLSLGGIVGQWFGLREPARLDRLVLVNTSAYLGPAAPWDAQITDLLDAPDLVATADAFLGNWFPPHLLTDERVVGPFREDLLAMDPGGLAGALAAVRDTDLRRTNALVGAPTLVVAGTHDTVTRPEHGRAIADTIPDARFVELPTVHLSNVEMPAELLSLVETFLAADPTKERS